eukprot:scaffold602_cov342-Prasinococcus_capsulatus_cf.AAC.16
MAQQAQPAADSTAHVYITSPGLGFKEVSGGLPQPHRPQPASSLPLLTWPRCSRVTMGVGTVTYDDANRQLLLASESKVYIWPLRGAQPGLTPRRDGSSHTLHASVAPASSSVGNADGHAATGATSAARAGDDEGHDVANAATPAGGSMRDGASLAAAAVREARVSRGHAPRMRVAASANSLGRLACFVRGACRWAERRATARWTTPTTPPQTSAKRWAWAATRTVSRARQLHVAQLGGPPALPAVARRVLRQRRAGAGGALLPGRQDCGAAAEQQGDRVCQPRACRRVLAAVRQNSPPPLALARALARTLILALPAWAVVVAARRPARRSWASSGRERRSATSYS